MNESFDEKMKSRARMTPEAQNTFVPGQVVGGKFKIISRLGSGGMGTVYRVEQIFLKKEFALKTMDNRTGSEVMIQRFQLEAKAAFSLNHPNLVKVHDFGILDNDNPYLVMDFINGITFAEYLKERGPLPIESVAPLFVQACFGLMAAHEQSVVHRDIKPANLMLLNNVGFNTEGCVKVVDFGIAKLVNREDGEIQALTRTGEIFGSPLYMSPEQCSSGTIDHRSDIYSLGCVLFEMLTGTPPHMGQNALKTMLLHQTGETPTLKEASLGQDFPEALERIVAKMLRKYPEQRYQNIGKVAHDLTMFGSENHSKPNLKLLSAIQEPQIAPPKVVSMTSTKFYTLIGLTGIFAAVIAGSGVYFINIQPIKKAPGTQTAAKIPPASDFGKIALRNEIYMSVPDEAKKKIVAQTRENAKLLEQLSPIHEVAFNEGDKKQRTYQFPKISLGEIYTYKPQTNDEPELKAQGIVNLRANKLYGLKMRGPEAIAMLMSPSIFKKIPGKAFHRLVLAVPTDGATTRSMPEDLSSAKLEENVTTAVQNLDGWTNLEGLVIESCSLNQDALSAINKIEKLQSLTLDHCTLNPKILAKQPFFSKLEECSIQKCAFDDNNPIINRLGGSSVLQRLAWDGSISSENLHNLQHCPKLSVLQLRNAQIDDEKIAAICGMKKLKEVHLLQIALTDEQIRMLTNCAWLKRILLSKSFYEEKASKVQAMDPRIAFE